jgi:flavin-dependent dehydrogenase
MSAERVRVVIVGGGPAGCGLAALLAGRGIRSVVFDDDKRPELLVGESLLPTVVTVLRRLGIEERVAGFSTHKPGVTFVHRRGTQLVFTFPERAAGGLPNYAYNVPRPQFDNLLRTRAEELGVTFVRHRAELVRAEGDLRRELHLGAASLAAAEVLGGRQPDLVVDASGRARVSARVLGLGARRGDRNDAAYFAHYENFGSGSETAGQVVISTLSRGWSWRIPLPGRLSVGVVIDREAAARLGESSEERLENAIRSEPLLAASGRDARRVTPVMTYSNYQLVSERGHGPGWVAAGDAFGFVDPMLSPGLFMALEAATLLDRHAFAGGAAVLDDPGGLAAGFSRYVAEMEDWHRCWKELIGYFYDGRIFSLYEGGEQLAQRYGRLALPRLIERHLTRQIAGMASGARTRSGYSRRLLRFATRRLVWDVAEPEEYAVLAG